MQMQRCDGKAYACFLVAGTYFLRRYRTVINDLNVFPVPDGDTGTNMYFTARRGMLAARRVRSPNLSAVAAAAAEGALMGARGNSGVILAQMLRGFARGVEGQAAISSTDLAGGVTAAALMAWRSVLKPVEGTMLSVASAAADAAAEAATKRDLYAAMEVISAAAQAALERTPEQLAILKEAGVVDAGGQGFLYFLEGALRVRDGLGAAHTKYPRRAEPRTTFTQAQKVETHRFCTEFVVLDSATDADALRELMTAHGDSLIVAGGDGVLRVHIHTDFPAKVTAAAGAVGSVQSLKVDDMEKQHEALIVDREAKAHGIVCVTPGEGFAKICRELGADVAMFGGPTKNPSVGDLVQAIERIVAPVIYVMPNDKNVVPAARQAARLVGDRRVIVVPTRNIAEGVAALFVLQNAGDDAPADSDEVIRAVASVFGGSIFAAGRDASIGGVTLKRNQLVGAIDAKNGKGERLVGGEDAAAIAVGLVHEVGAADASLITLYYGAGRNERDVESVAEALRAAFPAATIETYYGGQASSEYMMSIER